MLLTALLALTLAAPARADKKKDPEKPIRALGTLAKEPKFDGVLKDFTGATDLKGPKELEGKAAWRKDTLYVAAKVSDADIGANDVLDLNLSFPNAGTTARGFVYRVGVDGVRATDADVTAPEWVRKLVRSNAARDAKGVVFEIAIPARALPRFPAQGQLGLNLCLDWVKQPEGGAASKAHSSCSGGDMAGGPAKLPEELRKLVKGTPPGDVEGLEARPDGWVGYAVMHYPLWVVGDNPLTVENLGNLVAGDADIDPATVQLPIPKNLALGDNRPVMSVLTGKNPYVGEECKADHELRLALYVVSGKVGARVLEWPVATCALGRAKAIELSPEGALSISYSNGSRAQFNWANDHFERTEVGTR